MRYFLDCEFDGFGGPLISLALAGEQKGVSLYLVVAGHESIAIDPWVQANVVPVLHACPAPAVRGSKAQLSRVQADWLNDDPTPTFIADWPDDIRYLCQLLITGPGQMITTSPKLKFEVHRVDAYPTALAGAVQHCAWWDAMALRHLLLSHDGGGNGG